MAITKFPKDRGLSTRMGFTIFLIGLLYVVFISLLIAVGVQSITVIIIAAALLFSQYYFSDKIALYSMGARIVSAEQAPELHAIVDRLVAMADMPKPRVAIADIDMPNAFATGRSPKAAVVCTTTGLLRRLDTQEIEAVLAHELSHVAHKDVAVMTIASFLGMVAGFLTRIALWSGMFMGGGNSRGNNNSNSNAAAIELAVVLVSAIIYAISFLLTRALSRYRELSADRSGAILIGRPSMLASALVKVSGEIGRIPTRDLRSASAFNAFYFAPALTQGVSLGNLVSTHPTLEKRLEQLSKLEEQMNRPS
ncbi:MAG: zinc metalloprotease HtpX [Actinomycetota bacterium]|jgi:heat shock protein HtpX|nr:zinc metalloprotease HtpX [Actinomycetota bacterium]